MNSKNAKYLLWRYAKFATSTLAGTAVDMLVLWLCAHFLLDGSYWREYILSPFISFECAVFTNFIVAYYGVWRDRISARTKRSFWRHYGGYNLSCTGAFFVKMAILLLFERIFGWDVLWCNIAALCVSGLLNFFLNEKVVFRPKK
jgi:putative flippase GtrA